MHQKVTNSEIHRKLRSHLEQEFERRCRMNPRYSLRAYARSLDVDCSYLSKFLNSKRVLSKKGLQSFAQKLNFPSELGLQTPKSAQFDGVHIDSFKLISDWYHYAILELTRLDDFQSDIQWIAGTLNISYGVAFGAVERLKRLGLLETTADGRLVCARSNTTTVHRGTHEALRHLQREILRQAQAALEEVPIEKRDQSSITMAVDARRLPEAKRRIARFRRELMEFLEGSEEKQAVYQLSVSLFPVSHRRKERISHA